MATIKADELAEAIGEELDAYFEEVSEDVKAAVQSTAAECVAEIKRLSPKRTKKYSRSWITSEVVNQRGTIKIIVHNKRHYRLTHLLENGHAKKNGGRVEAIPHIAPAEKNAEINLLKKVEVAIKK